MKYTDKMAEFNSLWMEQNEIYRRAAKNFGISESVFWILYSLTEAGGTLRQSVISAMTCLPKQTTNSALKKLESDGMITMELSPEEQELLIKILNKYNKQLSKIIGELK